MAPDAVTCAVHAEDAPDIGEADPGEALQWYGDALPQEIADDLTRLFAEGISAAPPTAWCLIGEPAAADEARAALQDAGPPDAGSPDAALPDAPAPNAAPPADTAAAATAYEDTAALPAE
mgnify:CR=1 FL=1